MGAVRPRWWFLVSFWRQLFWQRALALFLTLRTHLPLALFSPLALLLFLLLSFEPFQTRVGQLTAILMMCYAMHRFLNELLRSDPRPVSLESNVSLFLFLAGALLLAYLQWKGTRVSNTAPVVV